MPWSRFPKGTCGVNAVRVFIGVVALPLTAMGTSTVAGASEVSHPVRANDLTAPVGQHLLPAGTNLEVQNRQARGGMFGAWLREHLNPQLGVVGWSDDGSEFIVRGVGFATSQIALIRDAARQFDIPAAITQASVTTTELERLDNKIREQVLDGLPPGIGWSIGVDQDTRRISVAIDGSDTLTDIDQSIRLVAEGFAADLAIERTVQDLTAPTGVATGGLVHVVDARIQRVDWRDTLHARGGEWVVTPESVCTSGFLFRWRWTFRLSTAGHCADGGDWEGDTGGTVGFADEYGFPTGTAIGTITHNFFESGGTDIALMTLPGASTTIGRVTTGANWYRDVTGVRQESSLNHNDTQCFVGWGTHATWNIDKKCGPQKKANITIHPQYSPSGYVIEGLYCLERQAVGGDSGGPVYYESGVDAIAAGTLVFSLRESHWFTTTKLYACYHTITDLESATGHAVVT